MNKWDVSKQSFKSGIFSGMASGRQHGSRLRNRGY